MDYFKSWSNFEKIWLACFTAILLVLSYKEGTDLIGLISTMSGMLCVVLVAKGNIWNYFWGVINVTLYAYIAYNSNYGGDFVLNAFYYLPMQFVGFYMWRKHYAKEDNVIQVKSFDMKMWVLTPIVLLVGTVLIGQLMPYINGLLGMEANPLPFADAFTTFGSIFAMILMVKRYKEQWTLWIIINILSIVMWAKLGNVFMVTMWSAYLINSSYGLYNWSREEKSQKNA